MKKNVNMKAIEVSAGTNWNKGTERKENTVMVGERSWKVSLAHKKGCSECTTLVQASHENSRLKKTLVFLPQPASHIETDYQEKCCRLALFVGRFPTPHQTI